MADIVLTGTSIRPINDDAEVETITAGEAITVGQACYMIAASGKAGVADANAAGKEQVVGIALQAAGADGVTFKMLRRGKVAGYTLAGNYASIIYLSDTAGSFADGAGTLNVPVGQVGQTVLDGSITKVFDFNPRRRQAYA
jgi:hypothetical protein